MKRHFNKLIDRICSKCGEMQNGRLFSYYGRKNINEMVFYQRAQCNICRSKAESERRKNIKK